MGVDKGGLDYSVKATAEFQGLVDFTTQLKAARIQMNLLSSKAASLGISLVKSKEGSDEQAKAVKKTTKAIREEREEIDRSNASLNTRARAIRQTNAEGKRLQINRAAAEVTAQREFNNERRRLTLTQAQQAAARNITGILNKRLILQARANEVAARGIVLTDAEAKSLGLLSRATTKAAKAEDALNAARRLSETRQSRAETIKLKAQDKEALRALLASEGLDVNGKPLPTPKPQLTLQDKVARIKSLAANKEAIRQLLLADGLDAQGRPLPAPKPVKTIQEKVSAIKELARERGAIESLLAAQGLDARGRPLPVPKSNAQVIADKARAIREAAANKEGVRAILAADGLGLDGKPLPVPKTSQQQIRDKVDAIKKARELKDGVKQLLLAEGLNADGTPLKRPNLSQRIKDMLGIGDAAARSEKKANRAAFTFRRLFGILAAFAAARAVIRTFRDIVTETVRFNAKVEQIQLGIASLFTAVGDVRDATGRAVDGSRALAVAQGEARRQTALLRRDALRTTASFEDLATTFQTAVAPGLSAGLDVDQIREFTVAISQAAATIGLEQNQLAEEIRSILNGTIQARQTRIATALGITNDDIRRAKELGTLSEFLQQRFKAFSIAGEASLNTFDAILSNVKDALSLLLGTGAVEFFTTIKDVLKETFDLITNSDPISGVIEPDERAVNVVRALAQGLKEAVISARGITQGLSLDDAVRAARAIGNAISVAADAAVGFVKGIIKGFGDLGAVADVVLGFINSLVGKDLFNAENISKTAELLGRILTVLFGISAAVGILGVAFGAVNTIVGTAVGLVGALLVAAKAVAVTAAAIATPTGLIVAGILAAAVGMGLLANEARKWASEVLGVELKFHSLVKLVRVVMTNAFTRLFLLLDFGWQRFVKASRIGWLQIRDFVLSGAEAIVEQLLSLAANVSDTANEALIAFRKEKQKNNKVRDDEIAREEKLLKLIEAQQKEAQKLANINLADSISTIIRENANTATLGQFGQNLLQAIKDKVTSGLKSAFADFKLPDIGLDFSGSQNQAKKLSDEFDTLPASVSATNSRLDRTGELVKSLADEIENVNDDLRVSRESLGLQGALSREIEVSLEGQVALRKQSRLITVAQREAQGDLLGVLKQQRQAQEKINKLSDSERALLEEGVAANARIQELKFQIAESESQITLDRLAFNKAVTEGADEEQQAASSRLAAEQQILAQLQVRLKSEKDAADALLNGLDGEAQSKITKLILQRISLSGREQATHEKLKGLADDRAVLENRINEAVNLRLALLSQEEAFELRRQARLARVEADAASRAFEFRNAPQDEQEFAAAQSELEIARQKIALERESRELQIQRIRGIIALKQAEQEQLAAELARSSDQERQVELLGQVGASQEAIVGLQAQLNQLEALNVQARRQENIELQRTNEQLDLARRKIEQPITTGFTEAVKEFVRETPSKFQSVFDIIKTSLESFVDFAGNAITDAFDPTTKVDLKERFGRFLQDIARQIINTLIRIAVAKAALRIVGGFNDGGSVEGLGFNKGGRVHGPHSRAKGYRTGGPVRRSAPVRPKGLHPKDNVPIWASQGEWVIKRDAVKAFGDDFLGAINQMLINPLDARALLGGVRPGPAGSGPGFISGGKVASKVNAARSATSVPSTAQPAASGQPTPAFLVANEETAVRLIRGGKNAWIRELDELGFQRR